MIYVIILFFFGEDKGNLIVYLFFCVCKIDDVSGISCKWSCYSSKSCSFMSVSYFFYCMF